MALDRMHSPIRATLPV